MKRLFSPVRLLALFLAISLTISAQAATIPWTDNGVDWGSNYYRPGVSTGLTGAYDGLPTDAAATSPAWKSVGVGSATLNPEGKYLSIGTTGAETRNFNTNRNWDASVAMTVEFEFRIVELGTGALYGGSVTLGNSNLFFDFLLGATETGELIAGHGKTVKQDVLASDFNTIRLTMESIEGVMTLKAYLNGSEDPFQTTSTSTAAAYNNLRFGDASTNATVGGSMEWRSIKWKSGEAIAPMPIPEPTSIALGGTVLATFLLRRYVRRC